MLGPLKKKGRHEPINELRLRSVARKEFHPSAKSCCFKPSFSRIFIFRASSHCSLLSVTPHHNSVMSNFQYLVLSMKRKKKVLVLRLLDEGQCFKSIHSCWTALCDTQDDGSGAVKARGTKAGWGVAYRSGIAGGCNGALRGRTYSVRSNNIRIA